MCWMQRLGGTSRAPGYLATQRHTLGWGPPQTMRPAFLATGCGHMTEFSLIAYELSVVCYFHIIYLKENWLPFMSALPLVGALAASTMMKMMENNMEGTWVLE